MVSVYGVMAYAVSQRSSEIGLRLALGASTGSVLRLILGQGLALAGIGLCLGLTAAVAGTRFLRTMLFQVQPNDPFVYLGVAVLLGFVTLIASYVPARRVQDRSGDCNARGIARPRAGTASALELVLRNGERLRISNQVDAVMLRMVLEAERGGFTCRPACGHIWV